MISLYDRNAVEWETRRTEPTPTEDYDIETGVREMKGRPDHDRLAIAVGDDTWQLAVYDLTSEYCDEQDDGWHWSCGIGSTFAMRNTSGGFAMTREAAREAALDSLDKELYGDLDWWAFVERGAA